MIPKIDEAMVALQRAMFAVEHYGPEHPAVGEGVARCAGAMGAAMGSDGRVGVMNAAGRIVSMGRALGSSGSLRAGLFARLRDRGAASVVLSRGVGEAEIREFVMWLARGEGAWSGSRLIRLGSVESSGVEGSGGGEGGSGGDAGARPVGPDASANVGKVRGVWTAVSRGDAEAIAQVEPLAASICGAVSASGGALIPLAGLHEHDQYTFVHTTNVAILASALAEQVGLAGHRVMDVAMAALLHDVGKRVVPRRVLNKDGKLTDSELAVMRRHPAQRARLLFSAESVPDIVPIVAFEHHIHLDGSGYPYVSRGWRPSLASQIVQLADVYDALRTIRPYRGALSREDAKELMSRDVGRRFDGDLLGVFLDRVVGRTDREALPELWTPGLRKAG